jgi:hypothetical protein
MSDFKPPFSIRKILGCFEGSLPASFLRYIDNIKSKWYTLGNLVVITDCFEFLLWILEFEIFKFGVWLSWIERCVRDAEVAGSSPATPTNHKPLNLGFWGRISTIEK